MRDVFEDIFKAEPPDPTEAARRNLRPALRKRFYARVGVAPCAEGAGILLDGKPVRTPARRLLAAPVAALARAIAEEWDAHKDVIDPAAMPLTRLANAIVDGVTEAPGPVKAEVAKYLASDLVLYRAAEPTRFAERQRQHWDPILAFARTRLGAHFVAAEGIVFVPQNEAAIAAAATAIPGDPWRLGAVSLIATLTGSALIALALAQDALTGEAAWAAAHVDEDWNMELWGCDALVLERRAYEFRNFEAAMTVLRTLR